MFPESSHVENARGLLRGLLIDDARRRIEPGGRARPAVVSAPRCFIRLRAGR